MRRDLVKTGVEGLDELVGGLPRGGVIVVTGSPGTGKTSLAASFIYNGAIKYGEPGVYASLIEDEGKFYEYMSGLGYDFDKLKKEDLFKYLALPTLLESGVASSMTLTLDVVESIGAKRLVIDSYTALSQMFKSQAEARAFMHTLVSKVVRQLECTTILIREEAKEGKAEYGFEEFIADGVILLNAGTLDGRQFREMKILKMRGAEMQYPIACFTLYKGFKVFTPEGKVSRKRPSSFKPLEDPPGGFTTGMPELDNRLGGYSPGSSILLEIDPKLTLDEYAMIVVPPVANYVAKNRPYVAIPTGGVTWKEIIRLLREYGLEEEKLSKLCKIVLESGPETETESSPYILRIETSNPEEAYKRFVELVTTMMRKHGIPPIKTIGMDRLAYLFREKALEIIYKGIDLSREVGCVMMWLVKPTQPWLVERLAPLADIHLKVTRRHGCIMLYGIKPRTPLYAVQPDPTGKIPTPRITPIT